MWQFWIIASGIFFVAEIFTAGFLVFWLGVAALIAMISSFITSNIIIQTAIFVIFSVILLFATRPFVNKFVNTKTIPTNAFSIIGKTALVVQEINPIKETGQIKINGEVWSAISENGQIIPKDSEVKITSISGVKSIVSLVKLATTK